MKCIKMLSIAVALFGTTVVCSSQTLQDVIDARNKGAELMAAKDLDGAIAELEKCVELAKQVGGDEAEDYSMVAESALPNLYLQKANSLNAAKDFPATIKALETAVAAAEKYNSPDVKANAERTIPQIYLAMGVADYQAQRFTEALANLDQVIALDPNNARAYFIKGACYTSLKDDAKMEESYKLTIEKGTANGDAANVQSARSQLIRFYNNAGTNAQKTQKWDEAITAFKKTVEVDENNSDALYSLSACYNSKKGWDDAISSGERALELRKGGDAKALDGVYYQLGTAYAGKNNTAKACEYFKLIANEPFLAGAKYQIETALKCK